MEFVCEESDDFLRNYLCEKLVIYTKCNTDLIQQANCIKIDDTKLAIYPIYLGKSSISIATLSVSLEFSMKTIFKLFLMIHHCHRVNFCIELSNFTIHLKSEYPQLNDEKSIFAINAFISHITLFNFPVCYQSVQFRLVSIILLLMIAGN